MIRQFSIFVILSLATLTGCLSSKQKSLMSPFQIQAPQRDSQVTDEEYTKVSSEIEEIEGLQLTAKVKSGDNKGYWSTGLMVGRYREFVYRGEFIVSEHLQFDLGALIKQPDQLFYTPYRVLIALYKKSVKASVLGLNPNKPVVIRYVRKNPLNPFRLSKSPFYAYKINSLNETFRNQLYFEDTETGKGSAGEGDRYGRVVRVDRWGVFGKTCTMYLHEGKEVSDNRSRITPMNLYTEEGCRYAENLAITGTHARFRVSFQFVEVLNGNRAIVHKIWANGSLDSPPETPDNSSEPSEKTPSTTESNY